jgi:serine/threonine protein kinase/lipopolysaccharide biosynthesis regulator YciM
MSKTPEDKSKLDDISYLKPNQQFGAYEIIEEIGRGGMGFVYKAIQRELGRIVALKLIRSDSIIIDEKHVQMFKREVEATASLRHPNIISIHDYGVVDGRPYFTMDYIEGCSLNDLTSGLSESTRQSNIKEVVGEVIRVKKKESTHQQAKSRTGSPLAVSHILALMLKIIRAVEHAHDRGIMHRDLKPSNIMIDRNGEPVIMDFGLAKRLHSGSDLTRSGQLVGTPEYMSPEQALGKREEINEKSDIYSLGAVFYRISTGRPPLITAGDIPSIINSIVTKDPPRIRDINPKIPRDIQIICGKALEKDPERRYRTAGAFANDIQRYIDGEPIRAKPASIFYKTSIKIKKHKMLSVSFCLLFLLIFGFLGYWIKTKAEFTLQQKKIREAQIALEQEKAKEMAKWILAYTDNFNRDSLGGDWTIYDKKPWWSFELDYGKLRLTGTGSKIYSNRHVVGNIRLEFDAMISGANEISCFLKCDTTYRYGGRYYYICLANDICKIEKGPRRILEHVMLDSADRIAESRKYHIVMESEDEKIRLKVNGKIYMEVTDFFPYSPNENYIWGFFGYGPGSVLHDNLKVYRQLLPEKISVMKIGDLYYNNGMYEKAENFFKNLVDNYENPEIARTARRKLLFPLIMQNKHAEVILNLKSIEDRTIYEWQIVEILKYYENQSKEDSLSNYVKNLVIENRLQFSSAVLKTFISPYLRRGNLLRWDGKYSQARPYYQKALDIMPGNSEALQAIGTIYANQKDYSRAIEFYKKAADSDPEPFFKYSAYVHLGTVYQNIKKDYKTAERYFNQAIALNPTRVWAQIRLGALFIVSNQPDNAIDNFNKILSIESNNAIALSGLAYSYYIKNEIDTAIVFLKKAVDTRPHLAVPYYVYGLICQKRGENRKALENYEKYLEYAGNFQRLIDARKEVTNTVKKLKASFK